VIWSTSSVFIHSPQIPAHVSSTKMYPYDIPKISLLHTTCGKGRVNSVLDFVITHNIQ
jgi:hypothetical protein